MSPSGRHSACVKLFGILESEFGSKYKFASFLFSQKDFCKIFEEIFDFNCKGSFVNQINTVSINDALQKLSKAISEQYKEAMLEIGGPYGLDISCRNYDLLQNVLKGSYKKNQKRKYIDLDEYERIPVPTYPSYKTIKRHVNKLRVYVGDINVEDVTVDDAMIVAIRTGKYNLGEKITFTTKVVVKVCNATMVNDNSNFIEAIELNLTGVESTPVNTELELTADTVGVELDSTSAGLNPVSTEFKNAGDEIGLVGDELDPPDAELDPFGAELDPFDAELDPLSAELESVSIEFDTFETELDTAAVESISEQNTNNVDKKKKILH